MSRDGYGVVTMFHRRSACGGRATSGVSRLATMTAHRNRLGRFAGGPVRLSGNAEIVQGLNDLVDNVPPPQCLVDFGAHQDAAFDFGFSGCFALDLSGCQTSDLRRVVEGNNGDAVAIGNDDVAASDGYAAASDYGA